MAMTFSRPETIKAVINGVPMDVDVQIGTPVNDDESPALLIKSPAGDGLQIDIDELVNFLGPKGLV